LADLPKSVERVMDRMDASIPTDITAVDESIAALDKKFDELQAYRNDPKRTHTTEQIDEVEDLLNSTKKELQNYKEAIIDNESEIKPRTTTQGVAEAKADETPAVAEVKAEPKPEVKPEPVVEEAKSEPQAEPEVAPKENWNAPSNWNEVTPLVNLEDAPF